MNDLMRTLATPLSPVMVSIINNPAPAVRPSGELTIEQREALDRLQHPWTNADGSTNATAVAWTAVSVASGFASAYHGAKRNNGSVGWGLLWGLMGTVFPVVTPAIALAQGYAKPQGR